MMATDKDIWQLLEESAPEGCEAVQDLYSWSLNYDAGKGPFSLFVDLIGWSDEHYGVNFYANGQPRFGWMELDKLGLALREYADRPGDVEQYVALLMSAEDN